jgi:hypothetical protein
VPLICLITFQTRSVGNLTMVYQCIGEVPTDIGDWLSQFPKGWHTKTLLVKCVWCVLARSPFLLMVSIKFIVHI